MCYAKYAKFILDTLWGHFLRADFWRLCAVGTLAYFDCDVTAHQRNDEATDMESNHDGLPQYETTDNG